MSEKIINRSVGYNCINNNKDVKVVQGLINSVSNNLKVKVTLGKDGICGPKTIGAIRKVQEEIVKMLKPNGVVDPCGKTIRVMTTKRNKAATLLIQYRKNARRELSQYTLNILKLVMDFASIKKIDISSTRRRVEDQVRIMYGDLSKAKKVGKTVRQIRGYGYGKTGSAVDKMFTDNENTLSEKEIKDKMAKEIRKWLKKGVRTSKHCVDKSQYDRMNVLDVPYSSVKPNKRDEFEAALIAISNEFNTRRFSNSDKTENVAAKNLIQKTIVERACWHIEIPQDGKPLPVKLQ